MESSKSVVIIDDVCGSQLFHISKNMKCFIQKEDFAAILKFQLKFPDVSMKAPTSAIIRGGISLGVFANHPNPIQAAMQANTFNALYGGPYSQQFIKIIERLEKRTSVASIESQESNLDARGGETLQDAKPDHGRIASFERAGRVSPRDSLFPDGYAAEKVICARKVGAGDVNKRLQLEFQYDGKREICDPFGQTVFRLQQDISIPCIYPLDFIAILKLQKLYPNHFKYAPTKGYLSATAIAAIIPQVSTETVRVYSAYM